MQNIPQIENLGDFESWINGYDVGIRYADNFVGKIIEIIKNLGIYEDTLIIISSDHGENQGELQVFGDHATACHIVNRVPMIIKWPKKKWKRQRRRGFFKGQGGYSCNWYTVYQDNGRIWN